MYLKKDAHTHTHNRQSHKRFVLDRIIIRNCNRTKLTKQLKICRGGRASVALAKQHKPIAMTFPFWIMHIILCTMYQPMFSNMSARLKNFTSLPIGWVLFSFCNWTNCFHACQEQFEFYAQFILHSHIRSPNCRDSCSYVTDSKFWISAITIWLQFQPLSHHWLIFEKSIWRAIVSLIFLFSSFEKNMKISISSIK